MDTGDQDALIREILCDILEIEGAALKPDANFAEVYNADSLRAVEILAALEKRLKIKIPETELSNLTSLTGVKEVVSKCA